MAGIVALVLGLQGRGPSLRPGPTQAVSDDPQLAINVNTSPVVAVDARRPDTLVVAGRVDAPRLQCTVSVSTTGGEAWRRLDLPLAPEATNCFWPAAAFDDEGNLFVLHTPTGGPFNLPTGLWLQRFTPELSADGPPMRVSGPLTFQPRLAVEGRRVLVAWIATGEARAEKFLGFPPPPNPIVLARSDDGGRTFSPPVAVSEPGRLAVQPTLLAGPGGQVVVGALDLGADRATYQSSHEGQPGPPPDEPWRVVAWSSGDGGSTFGPATTVADPVIASQRVLIDLAPAPAFALDAVRGRMYAAWESGHDVALALRRRREHLVGPASHRASHRRSVPPRDRRRSRRPGRRGLLRPQPRPPGHPRRGGAGVVVRRWALLLDRHRLRPSVRLHRRLLQRGWRHAGQPPGRRLPARRGDCDLGRHHPREPGQQHRGPGVVHRGGPPGAGGPGASGGRRSVAAAPRRPAHCPVLARYSSWSRSPARTPPSSLATTSPSGLIRKDSGIPATP